MCRRWSQLDRHGIQTDSETASAYRRGQTGIAAGGFGALGKQFFDIGAGPAAVFLVFAEIAGEDRHLWCDLEFLIETVQEIDQCPVIFYQLDSVSGGQGLGYCRTPVCRVQQLAFTVCENDASLDLEGGC
jgi:hypothetical protein